MADVTATPEPLAILEGRRERGNRQEREREREPERWLHHLPFIHCKISYVQHAKKPQFCPKA